MSARRRITTVCILAVMAAGAIASPAAAQGLFGFLFGNRRPPAVTSYAPANPLGALFGERVVDPSPEPSRGASASYCVRTCDGRFFPMQRHAGATPTQLCNSFCPAAKTTVMYGAGIDNARANDGERYADMPNAFLYRQKVVDNCTCNGKDPMGLAAIDVSSDPTLRAGDIVATREGLTQFNGRNSREATNFTPIDAAKLSADMRKKLSGIEVSDNPSLADARPLASTEVSGSRNTRRAADLSAQLSR